MNLELHSFVKESLRAGKSRDAIQKHLSKAGWLEAEIKEALGAFLDVDFPVPVPRRRPYLSAREAFVYLVMFATLYTSATSFGTLLFQFINHWIPDPLAVIRGEYNISALRFGVSSLVIAFPVFSWLAWMVGKSFEKGAEKRESKIRKWLTYFTLFVAASIIIGDLISLVFNLLSGDLTLKFFLKILSILLIALTIFGYYLTDLLKDEKEKVEFRRSVGFKMLRAGVLVSVFVSVVAAFFLVGTPGAERLRQLDRERISNLEEISNSVAYYWDRRKVLPVDLEALAKDDMVYLRSVNDPKTGVPYEYRVIDATHYELCATFETDSAKDPERSGGGYVYPISDTRYDHGVGYACFQKEVVLNPSPATFMPKAVPLEKSL